MKKSLSTAILLIFFTCLTACGFHLRNQYNLPAPLFRLYLQTTEPYDPFILTLKQTLIGMKVVLTSTPAEANAVLDIEGMRGSHNLVSSNTTSQVNTYALTYSIQYTLRDSADKVLIGPQGVSASENYTVSSDQPISGSAQEQQLRSQLYQDVIAQLFNRLSSKKAKAALGLTV